MAYHYYRHPIKQYQPLFQLQSKYPRNPHQRKRSHHYQGVVHIPPAPQWCSHIYPDHHRTQTSEHAVSPDHHKALGGGLRQLYTPGQ